MSWMLGYSNVLNIYSSYISYGLITFVYKLEYRAFLRFSLPIFCMLEIVYEGFWVFMGIFKCANTYALTWSVCVLVCVKMQVLMEARSQHLDVFLDLISLFFENRFITEFDAHHFDCTDPATFWDQPVMAFPVLACSTIPNILHGCWWLNIGIHAFTASTLPRRAFSAALGLVPSSNERWLTTVCNSSFPVVFHPVHTYAHLYIHTDTHIDVIKIITQLSKKFEHTLN